MSFAVRGAVSIALLTLLGGCFVPMTTREAQSIASQRLTSYCKKSCGAFTLANTQKINNRWLVDFDAPLRKFTVTVEGNGNARVDTWNK